MGVGLSVENLQLYPVSALGGRKTTTGTESGISECTLRSLRLH